MARREEKSRDSTKYEGKRFFLSTSPSIRASILGGEVLSGFPLFFLKEIFSEIVGGKRASAHTSTTEGEGQEGGKRMGPYSSRCSVHSLAWGEERMGENIIKNLLNCPSLPPFHFHCAPSLVEQQCSHPHPARGKVPQWQKTRQQWQMINGRKSDCSQPIAPLLAVTKGETPRNTHTHTHTRSRILFFSLFSFFLFFS